MNLKLLVLLLITFIYVANAFNATIVYSSMSLKGTSYPKYRVWSNVTQRWSQEFEMSQNISGNGFMNFTSVKVLAQSNSTRVFAVVLGQATTNAQNNLSLYISNDSGWTWYKEATNFGNVTGAEGTIQARPFDMAEEPNSTRIMIAYDLESNSNTRDMAYRIWDGSLGAEQYVDFTQWAGTDLTLRHIDLESSPNMSSNEIIAAITSAQASPSHGSYAAVWKGSSWNNLLRISGTAPVAAGMTVAARYESLSYDAIVVANNGSNLMRVCEWKAAGNWNGCNTFDPNSVTGNDNIQALLFADPVSNNITLLNIDDLSDLTIGTWNSTNMTTWLTLDAAIDNTTQIAAFAYNNSNGFAAFFWDTDTTSATLSNSTYLKGLAKTALTITPYYGSGMNSFALGNPDPKSTGIMLAMRQNGTSYAITSFNMSNKGVWGTNGNGELISSKCTRNFTGIRCYDFTFVPPNRTVSALSDTTPPFVRIDTPRNQTHGTAVIAFNHTETDTGGLSACWYKLDGGANQTITCNLNTSFTTTHGSHMLALYTNDTNSNFNTTNVTFFVNLNPPQVFLWSPENRTYGPDGTININHTETDNSALSACWYKLDGGTNQTISCNLNLTAIIGEGRHNMTLHANDTWGHYNESLATLFTVDLTAPTVTINEPKNQTYNSPDQLLNFSVTDNFQIAQCWFSRDGGANTTLVNCKETTMLGFSEGAHNVTVFANDSANNLASDTEYFSIDTIAPVITIWEPINQTYNQTNTTFPLNATFSETINVSWYQLNLSGINITFSGRTDIIGGNGSNYLRVWTNDSVNNLGYSERYFTINQTIADPAPTPTPPANNTKLFRQPWFKALIDEHECPYFWPLSLLFCRVVEYDR